VDEERFDFAPQRLVCAVRVAQKRRALGFVAREHVETGEPRRSEAKAGRPAPLLVLPSATKIQARNPVEY
jgi:hypothetical protein